MKNIMFNIFVSVNLIMKWTEPKKLIDYCLAKISIQEHNLTPS
jgi:hypothetical protein